MLDDEKAARDEMAFAPTTICANCTVHCYAAAPREEVRVIMRYAGPRMLTRHPVLAVRDVLDSRRPAPALPSRPGPRRSDDRPD